MASRKLIVEVIGDASSLNKTLKQVDGTTKKFGKTLARSFGIGIGAAGFVTGMKVVIKQATEQAVAQKQLEAQFKATGMELGRYQEQIDKTVNSLSVMAGIEDDEVLQAFTLSFRATRNVTQGLRLTAIAADVAKARHIALAQATLALNKAYGGNVGALRRLGITIPNTLEGMQALEFVARRFAGQAAAGTTAQDRFNVALRNMEQAIGTALLPMFTKYTDKLAKWLGDAENQKKVQKGVSDGVKVTADAFRVLAYFIGQAEQAWGDLMRTWGKIKSGSGNDALRAAVNAVSFPFAPPTSTMGPPAPGRITSEDIALRGVGARQRGSRTATRTAALAGPAGFRARMAKLDIAFAKAQMTAGQKDDRAVLVAQMELVRQRIKRVKSLKDRRDLYGQLANLDGQIKQIDKDAQDAVDAANQKKLDAKKEEARRAKAAADKLKAAHKKAAEAARDAMQAAVAGARDMVGALFGGPVLSGAAGILGVSNARAIGGRAGIGALTADVKAQTAQASGFARDLRTLKKRGASGRLLGELSAQGMAGAGFAHTLATAKAGDLKTFLKAFAAREKVVQQIAHADVHARNVYINSSNVRAGATPTSQRRGRNGGTRGPSYLGFPTR